MKQKKFSVVVCYICKKECVGMTKRQALRFLALHIIGHKEILKTLNLERTKNGSK